MLESISTDHCPFNDEQKSRGLDDFSLVPNGLALIQHRLAKLWDEGVVAGRITRSQLVDRTSTTIARRFGLHGKGALRAGQGRRRRRARPRTRRAPTAGRTRS